MSTKDPMAVDESAMMVLLTSTQGSVLQKEDGFEINQTETLEDDPDSPLYKVRHEQCFDYFSLQLPHYV